MGKKGKYNQRNEQDEGKKKNFIITQQHLMDKTHMENTQFLPYLPIDSMYEPFTASQWQIIIVRQILRDLNFSLYLEFKNFWATLLYNPSFRICIHTCIRFFHRKWLNGYVNKSSIGDNKLDEEKYQKIKNTQYFQYTQALMRVVLSIYFRIVHFQEQNLQLSNLHHLKTQIVSKCILDIPRLLEIIQIYGQTNQQIVKVIIKKYTNLNPAFYASFTSQIMQPMINKMNKNLNYIKKTSDRQQFGIQFNYKRTIENQLSPGEQQLSKKIKLLMEIISFYQTQKNIQNFFPSAWAEYTKFNLQVHNISENLFIQIEQAYKIWNNHDQAQILYALMNRILKYIIDYFVGFLEKCQSMFVAKTQKSNYKQAYMKCLDRMIQSYGRRQSLGKKASTSKRYMDLYRQILKFYKIDQFTSKLYVQEVENGTYGINMDYLVDFKIAIDEQLIKIEGRAPPRVNQQQHHIQQQKTQADNRQQRQQQIEEAKLKEQKHQQQQKALNVQPVKEAEIDKLQVMISKRNREEDYYQKLYKDYRTKIVIQYDDQYDDLIDYEKRPMFEDNAKQEQDSSDGSSGDQFNEEMEQLHLVKSNSNVNRARGLGTQHRQHQKYNRKQKAKFVPVRQAEATAIINRQANKNKPYYNKQKAVYEPKRQQKKNNEDKNSREVKDNKREYNDEQCYQQCRQKNKQQKQQREQQRRKQIKEQKNTKKQKGFDFNSEEQDDMSKGKQQKEERGYQRDNRGGRGGRGGRGSNFNNHNNAKGTNTNKKPKYVAKD